MRAGYDIRTFRVVPPNKTTNIIVFNFEMQNKVSHHFVSYNETDMSRKNIIGQWHVKLKTTTKC